MQLTPHEAGMSQMISNPIQRLDRFLPCCPSTVKTAASFSVESLLKKKTSG